MKIRNRLTVIYLVIVSVILVCLNIYIYLLSQKFTIDSFYTQLKDRALITATLFLEADERNNSYIHLFQNKYLKSLPGEIIRVFNSSNQLAFIDTAGSFIYDKEIINEIRQQKEVGLQKDGRQIVGILYQDNQGDFVIIASAVDEIGNRNLLQLQKVLLIGFVISMVFVFISGRYFTKLVLRPVSVITAQANKISETNLHLRLDEGNKKDELAELSMTINKMLYRLENAFEAQKNFVSNASHELRTPLTSIIGNIEVTLNKARTVEEHKAVLASIMREAEKLHDLTNGLLDLAQSNLDFTNLKKEEIRLDELLLEVKNTLKTKQPGSNIRIIFPEMPENPDAMILSGNRKLFESALLNIMDNACKFSENKEVTAELILDEDYISIKIKDNGIGIKREEIPHITETFYRASNARSFQGSGIGMALASKIIDLHGGTISIHSEIDKGTEVSINFPMT